LPSLDTYFKIHSTRRVGRDSDYEAVTPAAVSAVARRRAQRAFTRLPRKTAGLSLDSHCQQSRCGGSFNVGGQSFLPPSLAVDDHTAPMGVYANALIMIDFLCHRRSFVRSFACRDRLTGAVIPTVLLARSSGPNSALLPINGTQRAYHVCTPRIMAINGMRPLRRLAFARCR